MCRAPPKPSPTPSPQPVICIYCGSSDHRSMECSNHPRDNREEGHAPSPSPNWYNHKNNGNLLPLLEKICRSPMVNQEIMTNLGPQAKILRNPRQAGNINSHNIPHKANKIIIAFLTGITDTTNNRDRQGSTRSRINYIPLITLPLHLHSLQGPTCLVVQ